MLDEHAIHELELYAYNTYDLDNQHGCMVDSLRRKVNKGTYDPNLAPKLWQHWVDEAAREYCKEFGGKVAVTFPVAERRALADRIADMEYQKILDGEYEPVTE